MQPDFLKHTQILRVHHPSRSVNYYSDDPCMREELLESICEACHILNGDWDEDSRKLRSSRRLRYRQPRVTSPGSRAIDAKTLRDFFILIVKLCFSKGCPRPHRSIVPGPYYQLDDEHTKWLHSVKNNYEVNFSPGNHARALLVPIFTNLNNCFRIASWFRPVFRIKWQNIPTVLEGITPEFESACYLLAGGLEKSIIDVGLDKTLRQVNGDHDLAFLTERMNRITLHTKSL